MEAVKYVGTGQERLRTRKNRLRNRLLSMALSNMGRNRKKTVMVVSSLTLSVLVLSLVMTAAGSFKLDAYLDEPDYWRFYLGQHELYIRFSKRA